MVWVIEDTSGGWTRMKIKFDLNGLILEAYSVPTNPSAIKDAVADLVASCRAQGAEIPIIPTKPVTFSALISKLESLGLLLGSGDLHVPAVEDDIELHADHRADVCHIFLKTLFQKLITLSIGV